MPEHERKFRDLIDQCVQIRADWEDARRMWRERPSDEVLERCARLVREMSMLCATMQTITRQREFAFTSPLARP